MKKSEKKILVLCGPSGVGKGSISQILVAQGTYRVSVSCTTRKKRPEEVHGQHYFFLTNQEFGEHVHAGDFLEWKEVHDAKYGTLKSEVSRIHMMGLVPILEIDVQGALEIQKVFPSAYYIFVYAPSMEILRRRLEGRGTETAEKIELRLSVAETEEKSARENGGFNFIENSLRILDAVNQIDLLMHLYVRLYGSPIR